MRLDGQIRKARKPVHRPSALISTMLALLAIALVAAACGLDDGSDTSTNTTHATPTATSTPDPAAALSLNTGHALGASAGGLDLTVTGITDFSPGQPFSTLGIACSPGLVFASPNPTSANYSATDLQAIRNYVSSVPLTGGGGYPIPDGRAPSALRWLPIGGQCASRWDIHNSGTQQVTISAVGVQLIANPMANTYHYAQVDLCSISTRFIRCGFNSQGPDDGFFAFLTAGSESNGGAIQGPISAVDDTGPNSSVLLLPGQIKSISVRINPSDAQAAGVIYRVVPQLTVSDTTTHTITFSGLTQTLVFATQNQLSCYGLAGNAVVPPAQINYGPNAHSWC